VALIAISITLPASAQETGTIALHDLTADIVPTEARAGGNRDFNGNGPILTLLNMPGYLSIVTYLSDTTGDDISTDQNPHGDRSIRKIRFDPIQVEFFPSQIGG
jgi:hypothetical protein